MRIESLQYLIDFADLGTISAAAAKNFMSDQGMNRVLHQLEGECGITLFSKEGKTLRLTEAGKRLVEGSREVVSGYQRMQDTLGCYVNESKASDEDLYVYMTPLASLCVLPCIDILTPSLFPFRVKVREEDLGLFNNVSGNIAAGRAVGVITDPGTENSKAFLRGLAERDLTFFPLLESKVAAFASTSSPISNEQLFRVGPYQEHGNVPIEIVCPRDEMLASQISSCILEDHVNVVSSNLYLLDTQLHHGRAAILLPEVAFCIDKFLKDVVRLPIDEDHWVRFGMLAPKDLGQHRNARLFVEHVRDCTTRLLKKEPFSAYARRLV